MKTLLQMINSKAVLFCAIILVMLSMTFGGCKKEKDSNHGPTPCFTPNDTSVYMGDVIEFTNCTTDGLSYEWDFGDLSAHSGDFSPKHAYHYAGTFVVRLITRNAEGENHKTTTVTVLTPPSAIFQGNFEGSRICSVTGSHIHTTQTLIYANGLQGINIINIGDIHYDVYATVSGLNITIPLQVIDQLEISGSGFMSASHSSVTINYNYEYAGFQWDTCQSIYARQ